MRKYDLHIHSKFSDGDYTLEEIVDKLKENGIDIFSITDHDNADSIRAMQDVDIRGLIYIPGIEFSASKAGYKMHILGYNVDGNSQELLEACRNMKMRKNLRNLEIIQQLKERFGIVITREETIQLLNSPSFVGQTTIAKLLLNKGIIPDVKFAFQNYFSKLDLRTDATIDLDEAVRIIHSSGGIAVIAHPIEIEKKYNISIEDIIYLFKNAGIDGIEIFNSKHTLSDIKRYLAVAKREGLLISGGSDYHGEIMKPNVKLGRISKDGTEKQEHYEMTVISRCIARNNQLNQFTNEEKNEGESR